MLDRVIGAFNHLGLDLDDRDIADILWLAMQISSDDPAPLSELPQQTPAITPEIDTAPIERQSQNTSSKSSTKTETSADVYPQSSQDNQTASGLPIKVPTAQALRNKLNISRSLKPLKRRVPSKDEFVIDEIATAERIAEEKLFLPVMRPARDRWLEVALVIDESASMFLWQQTIKEFQQLLERHGAFRDVRTWGLFSDKDNKVWLRPRTGKLSHQKKLHNPKELIDPNGRRLFVIITDCVSPAWYDGAISKTLAMWANTSPTTILQVLPEWLWERSVLGVAESILLRSLVPGVPNQQLIMTALDLFDEIDVCNHLKIPVVTLEPESLKNWARMVAGAGEVQTKGFLLPTDREKISSEVTENSSVELTAKQRLQRFRLTASPMARKLAGLLAAAPVSLPVVRLIQQTMLDKSSQVHVAEVFLGGILKPLSPIAEDGEADKIQFDFADGVRDLLLDGVPLTESTEVLRRVSEYVAARVGLSVDEFTAMLVNPGLVDSSSGVLVRPFAQITAKVLKRLGGKYAELADKLEQSSPKLSQTDTSKRRKDLAIPIGRLVRVRKGYIKNVKLAVQQQEFPRQKDLAEALGFSLATVSNFLNGKPVDFLNFIEISERLGFDWQDIADKKINPDPSSDDDENESAIIVPEEDDDNFIYINRPPIEEICYETISQPGGLLRVKASVGMGKTSLMLKIFKEMAHQGYRTIRLDTYYAERNDFSTLKNFLKWFCVSVGQSLHVKNRLADYWDEEFSTPKMNCTAYFEEYLLTQSSAPMILWLDSVERIFHHEKIAGEFLGLLRAWHEQAKINPIWKQLRIVIVHSTEVYVPLKINESPFNVGVPIELPEFTPEQVILLAKKHGLEWDLQQVKPLVDKVGGHPYLTGQAFANLQRNPSVTLEQLLQTSATDKGIYGSLLRHYWRIIEKDTELIAALKKIVQASGKVCISQKQAYELEQIGLVKSSGSEVVISCELYREYFRDCFDSLSQ